MSYPVYMCGLVCAVFFRPFEQEEEEGVIPVLQTLHPKFRLFLCCPSTTISTVGIALVAILDRSIKVIINEPPCGLRASLCQAFSSFSHEDYEEMEPESRAVLFGLTYFHAIMRERQRILFGRKRFSMTDLGHAVFLVKECMAKKGGVSGESKVRLYIGARDKIRHWRLIVAFLSHPQASWADLRYTIGEVIYGAYLTNEQDRAVSSYLHKEM